MSNWFESNPTKSVILHTIVVAAAVWASFFFIFDENKVNFYEAKVSKVEAASREYAAKNEVLSTRLEYLKDENVKLQRWLESTPKSIPYYESKITSLNKIISDLKKPRSPVTKKTENIESNEVLYFNFKRKPAASTFFDSKTNAAFAVEKINYGNTADINLTLPNGENIKTKGVTPGETWRFKKNGEQYILLLDSVDWASGKYEASVIELQNEK